MTFSLSLSLHFHLFSSRSTCKNRRARVTRSLATTTARCATTPAEPSWTYCSTSGRSSTSRARDSVNCSCISRVFPPTKTTSPISSSRRTALRTNPVSAPFSSSSRSRHPPTLLLSPSSSSPNVKHASCLISLKWTCCSHYGLLFISVPHSARYAVTSLAGMQKVMKLYLGRISQWNSSPRSEL